MTIIDVDLVRTPAPEGDGATARLRGVLEVHASYASVQFKPDGRPLVVTDGTSVWYLEAGAGEIVAEPTPVGNALELTFYARGVPPFTRYVLVPDQERVRLEDLTQVDGASLEPGAEPDEVWWAALAALEPGGELDDSAVGELVADGPATGAAVDERISVATTPPIDLSVLFENNLI